MALTVRITTHDAQGNERVNEMQLEPGAQVPVSEGDRVEIIDSEGRPIEIIVDADDVVVTIPEPDQVVVTDGISRDDGAEEETYTFENLALYIEDETGSSIAYVDPDTEELTVIASIEDLLAGISTATGDEVKVQGTFGANGGEADPNDPSIGDSLGLLAQDAPVSVEAADAERRDPSDPTITVDPVNDAPTTDTVSASGAEGAASIAVTLTGSDLDGTVASFALSSLPANGTLYTDAGLTTLAATATDYAATVEALTLYFVPDADFNGTAGFSYAAKDDGGAADATPATATITVTSVNDAPTAVNDSATTTEDTAAIVSVLANDSDPDTGDTLLTVSSVTQGTNGTVVINGDNTVTYTPNAAFTGNDSFTYTVSDGNGGSDTATVNVTVNAAPNNAPVAEDDTVLTAVDTAAVIAVLANDTDPDSDPLNVNSVTQGTNGTVVINGDNTVTYTPNLSFSGSDSFTYTIDDGSGGTVTATVLIYVGTAIEGTSGDDVLTGGSANDVIFGLGGNDTLNGKAGDDTLYGGASNDTLLGDKGNDTLDGGAGNDTLLGDKGNDTLDGGAGNDTLDGGAGNDTLDGGAGNDTLDGGAGNDILVGGDGDDVVFGGAGADTFAINGEDTGTDTISDFDVTTDTLDIGDIFGNAGVAAELAVNLEFAAVDADGDGAADDTEVRVDTSGGTLGSEDAVAVLFNVSPVDLSTDPNTGNVDV